MTGVNVVGWKIAPVLPEILVLVCAKRNRQRFFHFLRLDLCEESGGVNRFGRWLRKKPPIKHSRFSSKENGFAEDLCTVNEIVKQWEHYAEDHKRYQFATCKKFWYQDWQIRIKFTAFRLRLLASDRLISLFYALL